jgi:hypothetical protein
MEALPGRRRFLVAGPIGQLVGLEPALQNELPVAVEDLLAVLRLPEEPGQERRALRGGEGDQVLALLVALDEGRRREADGLFADEVHRLVGAGTGGLRGVLEADLEDEGRLHVVRPEPAGEELLHPLARRGLDAPTRLLLGQGLRLRQGDRLLHRRVLDVR